MYSRPDLLAKGAAGRAAVVVVLVRQTLRVGALAFIVVAAIFAFTDWGPDKAAISLVVGVALAVLLFWFELRTRRR